MATPPPPPGRNPMAELPQEGIIPYGKPSPFMANLLQHKLHKLCNIGTACAIFVGRGGGEKSHRWELFTIWYFIRGGDPWGGGSYVTPDSPYSGNMMYPQQKNPFHTINYNQPYISRNMSACVVTNQLAHNQRLQVSG